MVEDFFTTYSIVEPPKIYKDNPDLVIQDTETSNITDYNISPEFGNSAIEALNYPGVSSPFKKQENLDIENQLTFSTVPILDSSVQQQRPVQQRLKGPKSFEKALEEAIKINPEVSKYRDFLIKTAKRESGFNSYIQNQTGAPYYGYFQMGRNEIKRTTGLSVEDFRKNPVAQILGAVKLYKMNLKTIKALNIYELGKSKGFSDDALVAGAWLGGPGGVKKYLLGLGDPSDSHWYKNGKGGTSVGKVMNQYGRT